MLAFALLISHSSWRVLSHVHLWELRHATLCQWKTDVCISPPPMACVVTEVSVPISIFSSILTKHLSRTIRPPSKKHLGTRLRETQSIPTAEVLWQELVSVKNGLPQSVPKTDSDPGIDRTESGFVKPCKSTAVLDRFKIKLQDPSHIKSLCRLEERVPGRGHGASMLTKDNRVAMAAAPFILRCSVPKGAAKLLRFPTLSLKMNVITMDENCNVTFGSKEYPPWVRRAC